MQTATTPQKKTEESCYCPSRGAPVPPAARQRYCGACGAVRITASRPFTALTVVTRQVVRWGDQMLKILAHLITTALGSRACARLLIMAGRVALALTLTNLLARLLPLLLPLIILAAVLHVVCALRRKRGAVQTRGQGRQDRQEETDDQ